MTETSPEIVKSGASAHACRRLVHLDQANDSAEKPMRLLDPANFHVSMEGQSSLQNTMDLLPLVYSL